MRNYLSKRNNDLGFGFFDEVFDDFFKPVFYGVKETAMKTDIKETEKGYELSIDMPGYDKKDINLSLDNGYLKVEAKREEKEEAQNGEACPACRCCAAGDCPAVRCGNGLCIGPRCRH